MQQILNLSIPKSWQELPDKELRFVFRLLCSKHLTLPQIKTRCLLRWAHLSVARREGAVFILRYRNEDYPVSALQILGATEALKWLGDFPQHPVRLSRIGIHRPVRADLQDVPFGDFLALDNLYHGYLQTKRESLLREMAVMLYRSKHIRLTEAEGISVFYWFTSVKRYFTRLFPHLFKEQDTSGSGLGGSLSFAQLQENMNAQIRALTGGDITKERQVLEMDCWRALTELNAKAKDYEDIKNHK